MNAFTTELVAQLRAAGHPAEAPWPTGGGCQQILVPAGPLEIGITNGDAALPDGEEFDGLVAYVSARDTDGDEIDAVEVPKGGSVVDAVNLLIARLA